MIRTTVMIGGYDIHCRANHPDLGPIGPYTTPPTLPPPLPAGLALIGPTQEEELKWGAQRAAAHQSLGGGDWNTAASKPQVQGQQGVPASPATAPPLPSCYPLAYGLPAMTLLPDTQEEVLLLAGQGSQCFGDRKQR